MAASPALEIRGLVAGFDAGQPVLHGVGLSVASGSILAVLGPNGAGKSTLLQAVAGLACVEAGSIRIDGQEVAGQPAHQIAARGVGYVPQSRNVFASLTVAENLRMGGYLLGRRWADALPGIYGRFPGLAERRHRRADTLSGGERQLLAVARALVARPRVLLLDEPSAGLAPSSIGAVFAVLPEIARTGVAVVLVEQNMRAALQVSDQALVLVDGRAVPCGDAGPWPAALDPYRQPVEAGRTVPEAGRC